MTEWKKKRNDFFVGDDRECLQKIFTRDRKEKRQIFVQLIHRYKSSQELIAKINQFIKVINDALEGKKQQKKWEEKVDQIMKKINNSVINQNLKNLCQKILNLEPKKKRKNLVETRDKSKRRESFEDYQGQQVFQKELTRTKTEQNFRIQQKSDKLETESETKSLTFLSVNDREENEKKIDKIRHEYEQKMKEKIQQIQQITMQKDKQIKNLKEELQKMKEEIQVKEEYITKISLQIQKIEMESNQNQIQNQVIKIASQQRRSTFKQISYEICQIFNFPKQQNEDKQGLINTLKLIKQENDKEKQQYDEQMKMIQSNFAVKIKSVEETRRPSNFTETIEFFPHISLILNSRILNIERKQTNSLLNSKKYCDFLINAIQQFYNDKKKIRCFKLLYSYSYLKPILTTAHTFIDDHPCLLFLAQLKKTDTIIGAYSESSISRNMRNCGPSRGFIFSIKKQKIFNLSSKGSTKYFSPFDQYYFIFGNGDLKFQNNTNMIRSNFGLNSSSFTEGGYPNVHDIFDQGEERMVEMSEYEFYQVIM